MATNQAALQAIIEKLAKADFVGGTDEDRAKIVKDINADIQSLAEKTKKAKKPVTMEDIVDKNAAKVDTSGIDVPAPISDTFEEDLLTLGKLAEADAASQKAALDAAATAAKLIIAMAPLLLV